MLKDALKNVDILDLVTIEVYDVVSKTNMGTLQSTIEVQVVPLDTTKNFVIDEKAKWTMEGKVMERINSMNPQDVRTKGYVKEFVGRMISELYRSELCFLEDASLDSIADHYADLRKTN